MSQEHKLAYIIKYNGRSTPLSRFHSKYEIEKLRKTWASHSQSDQLLWDLFPIKIVTVLEVFFRAWIKELVDHGAPFVRNASDLAKNTGLKFDYAVSQALVGRTVSLGDLVAHNVSLNGLEQLCSNLNKLLGEDYLKSISNIHDRWAVEVAHASPKPIIGDLEILRKRIAKLYAVRHIIVHEAPEERPYTESDIYDFFDAAIELIQATHERLSFLLHGNYPLTQLGMTEAAAEIMNEAKLELDTTLRSVARSLEFQRVQDAWEEYAELQARLRSGIDLPGRGSIAPMLYHKFKTDLIRARATEVTPKPEGEW